jgi:hypothetical protein
MGKVKEKEKRRKMGNYGTVGNRKIDMVTFP